MIRFERILLSVVAMLAATLPFALHVDARQPEPAAQDWQTTVEQLDWSRVVIWIDGSSTMLKTARGLDPVLLADGWEGFAKEVIGPEVAFARKFSPRARFVIHNPYGVDGGTYKFDQRRDCARDKRTAHVSAGLSEMLSEFVDRGDEPIIYLGGFKGDRTDGWLDKPGNADNLLREWTYAIGDVIESGASLALDASGGWPTDDYRAQFILFADSLLKTQGARVCIEPRPAKYAAHFFAFPIITQDAFWLQSDPREHADAEPWAAPTSELKGEIIRWVQFPDDDETGKGWGGSRENVAARLAKAAARVQRDGHTVAITTGVWRQAWGKQ